MSVRELKEEALGLYAQRRFAECARTYERLLELEPRDPHLYVRHAEACRRAGERRKAVAAYRTAADLLLQLGCDARARAALRVALELNPRDTEVARCLERMTPPALLTPVAGALQAGPPSVPPDPAPYWDAPRTRLSEGLERRARAAEPELPAVPPSSASEVRRLSDNTLALRTSPGTRWWVVSSSAPVSAYEVEDLERVEVPQDFSIEVTYFPDP